MARSILDRELRVDLFEMLVDCARARIQNLSDISARLSLAEPGKSRTTA